MPEMTPERIAEAFSARGVYASHACYATATLLRSRNASCVLCGTQDGRERFKLVFEITCWLEARTVIFAPICGSCIRGYNLYLRDDRFVDLANIGSWQFDGPVATVMAAERATNQRRAQRFEYINECFATNYYLLIVSERFGNDVRMAWAENLGYVGIDRALGRAGAVGARWRRGSSEENVAESNLFGMTTIAFNPKTMRPAIHGFSALLCAPCGRRLSDETGLDQYAPGHLIPIDGARRGMPRRCEFCHTQMEPYLPIDSNAPVEDSQAERETPSLTVRSRSPCGAMTGDEFVNDPRAARIRGEAGRLIVAALNREPGDIVYAIAHYALRHGTITERQLRVIRDRAAEDDPGAPICPDHSIQMRRRRGQYGDFYGCPRYPACRVTANRRGVLRNLPDDSASTDCEDASSQEDEVFNHDEFVVKAKERGKKFKQVLLAMIREKCR